jgi:[ribosomal protein S5]-alanine N-acetyltransferase
MDVELPLEWPVTPPSHGPVVLRPFRDSDAAVVAELSRDPYVPLISTVPPLASEEEGTDWILRQNGRFTQGVGYSFAIADAATERALGQIGLWLKAIDTGRATAGYIVAPSARGRGVAAAALIAVTRFAWTLPALHRVELYIEPWNRASIRTAEAAGYEREGLLRSHQQIGGERKDVLLYAAVRPGP